MIFNLFTEKTAFSEVSKN